MQKPTIRAQVIAKLVADLDEAEAHLSPTSPAITSVEKTRTLKMRKGGTQIVTSIGSLAKTHGMESSALHPDKMAAHVDTANALEPLEQRLERFLVRVKNERFVASSEAWSMALKFYAVLQRCALNDGELAQNLAPIESFFSYRHDGATKQTKAQTRAKAKLAKAQQLIATANARAAVKDAPVVTTATPVAPVGSTPAPTATPVATPSLIVPAPSNVNGVTSTTNGSTNGASNGAAYGAQLLNGGH